MEDGAMNEESTRRCGRDQALGDSGSSADSGAGQANAPRIWEAGAGQRRFRVASRATGSKHGREPFQMRRVRVTLWRSSLRMEHDGGSAFASALANGGERHDSGEGVTNLRGFAAGWEIPNARFQARLVPHYGQQRDSSFAYHRASASKCDAQ